VRIRHEERSWKGKENGVVEWEKRERGDRKHERDTGRRQTGQVGSGRPMGGRVGKKGGNSSKRSDERLWAGGTRRARTHEGQGGMRREEDEVVRKKGAEERRERMQGRENVPEECRERNKEDREEERKRVRK